MINHHEFFQIFRSNSEGLFEVFGDTLFPMHFKWGIRHFQVLFFINRRCVRKNLKKLIKVQLKISNQQKFFKNSRDKTLLVLVR